MSLFGVQTMMNAFRSSPTGGPNPAQESLDAVTQAIVNQTSNTLRETFQVGDKVQREIVDLSFQFLTLAPMRPGGGMSTPGGVTQQATELLRRFMDGMSGMMGGTSGMMGGAARRDCGCTGSSPPWTGARQAPPGAASPPPQPGAAAAQGEGWGPMPSQT
jgi:hypothetical protein